MIRRKLSLDSTSGPSRAASDARIEPSHEVLELFFDTGVVFHEVALPTPLPDLISGFKVVPGGDERTGHSVRRAVAGEEPDVEISALEHLPELAGRWLPLPYQLSCLHCVQVYLQPGDRAGSARALLAIDTQSRADNGGRHLDPGIDGGRPFAPLERTELGAFLDHAVTRTFIRELGRKGIERAPFKLAALLETLAPLMPRIRFASLADHPAVPVSLVLDLGNSRSSAVLVEAHVNGVTSVPLAMRDGSNPFRVEEDTFGSRITFLPNPFDDTQLDVAVGGSFAMPSLARLGREALDRALETPHRYACSLSTPKRYLWDGEPTDERWYFARKQSDEHRPVSGRLLKHLHDHGDGLALRDDGPATPADPRYAPRAMMLFALVEILQQAYAQISSMPYRTFQGREGMPRILRHLVLTYPSAIRPEELGVYETLVRNAVLLACHYLGIRPEDRPNWNAQTGNFDRFLVVDEALAAQMVYVYQEIVHSYGGSMEELVKVYGQDGKSLRIASVDIGGGTSDVMIAEYRDLLPGSGTALHVTELFQDGISIAGDDVCKAIVEDVVLEQVLAQLPSARSRQRLVQLLIEGDAGLGVEWRTLRAKLVPYFWLPLARCWWALAEGYEIPEHAPEKHYAVADVFRIFALPPPSPTLLAEVDTFLGRHVPGWPGLFNLFFRFDASEVDGSVERVLREPLRKYADILAQFDVDLLVLAGRTSKLKPVRRLFVSEMPVSPPRIKDMADYRVSEWYPSKWRENGRIKDPKSTVAAGASVLHLARRNVLPGLLLERLDEVQQQPIYGLYQESEPHIPRVNELFREGKTSPAFLYTRGMTIGFRNVDSQEMEGSPLFEVLPANAKVEQALLEDRVKIKLALHDGGQVEIAEVASQRDTHHFAPTDFRLRLRTAATHRYWLDTGVLSSRYRLFEAEREEKRA
ncbi:MAG: virulence factor SrfB [Deltaproteobacteria bacterium]|nr:virulence factor SrfB [Deltaproteobacteria bacterium]